MIEAPRKRGRPKGTGLNDAATLAAIARLRADDPFLKPTTAIRKLGITDPSVVRRLRDKLKIQDDGTEPATPEPLEPTLVAPLPPQRKAPKKVALDRRSKAGPLQTKVSTNLPRGAQVSYPSAPPQNIVASPPVEAPQAPKVPLEAAETGAATTASQHKPEPEQPKTDSQKSSDDPQTAQPGPLPDPQMEAMRLSAEAAAAVSRLYLHCITHAASISPLAIALRAQTNSSQWMSMLLAQQSMFGMFNMPKKS